MILIFNYNNIDIDNNVRKSNTNIHIINKFNKIISLLLCKYLPFLVNDNDDDVVNDNTDTNNINTNTINKLIDNIF